jgi:hypothetical protein
MAVRVRVSPTALKLGDDVIRFGMWLSLGGRLVRDEEVAGSNPVIPTITK